MLRVTYIGEEIAAQGFRLLGARTLVAETDPGVVLDAISNARGDSDLVLLDQDLAELIAFELKELLLREPVPPVLIVPELAADQDFSSTALEQARRELGLGAQDG